MGATERATVLIVNDEREVADAYAAQLSTRYDVKTADTGRAAMAALGPETDVVLLDRRLPDGSGRDVLAEIRDGDVDVRVAMVTAVEPDFRDVDMAFDDYVVKPATRGELVEAIERLLACADYEAGVREYYALTAKRAALAAEKSSAELEGSEAFRELEARIERRRAELDRVVESFDEADYEVVFRDLGVRRPTATDGE